MPGPQNVLKHVTFVTVIAIMIIIIGTLTPRIKW